MPRRVHNFYNAGIFPQPPTKVRNWGNCKINTDTLQTFQENFLDVLFGERGIGFVEALVDGDVVSHFVDPAVVDADLAEVHRDVDALEEFVCGVDGLPCDLLLRKSRVDAEDIDAVFDETVHGPFTEDMAHPARGDDGKSLAVGYVVIGAEGMFDAMTRPAGVAVAESQDSIASVGAGKHHFSSCGIVLRIFETLASVCHQAAQH